MNTHYSTAYVLDCIKEGSELVVGWASCGTVIVPCAVHPGQYGGLSFFTGKGEFESDSTLVLRTMESSRKIEYGQADIVVDDPRLVFAKVAQELFPEPPMPMFQQGSINMTDGFGWVRDKDGKLVKFPHYGGTNIASTASIAPTARIARAPLGCTVIEDGVCIDNMVHIAHGAHIGAHTSIAALSCIEGSVTIGKYCTLGSGVIFQIGSSCGDHVTVGSGSVVTKHIPDGETWAGVPARRMK